MSRTTAKLLRTYERLTYEQLPIAALLQRTCSEGLGGAQTRLLDLGAAEIGGVKYDFVPIEAGSKLWFRTRLAPDSIFSALIGGSGTHSGAEFNITVRSGGHDQILLRITIKACRNGNSPRWRRLKVDLNQFSGQEIALLLSGENCKAEDRGTLGWGDPRILRKRRAREYYANVRSRLAQGGVEALLKSARAFLRGQPDPLSLFAEYPRWLRKHSLTQQQLAGAARKAAGFSYQPLISLLTPTFNTDPAILRSCVQSVQAQLYPHWELCICDDGSSSDATRQVITESARQDSRIKAQFLPENHGIAQATSAALRVAAGEYIALLDHDDELSPDALYENVLLLQTNPQADVIYSDEDKLDADGHYCEPFFKPDWSPELLLSYMYTCHLSLYRRELVNNIGGFRPGFDGAQDYDLMLRAMERSDRIFHIPKVLYHWRMSPASTAAAPSARSCSTNAGLRALREHIDRIGLDAEVTTTDRPNNYRVKPSIRGNPLVSIIIPHKGQPAMLDKCIQSIQARTAYRNYELVIVDNGGSDLEALKSLSSLRHRIVTFHEPFNFSRMNNLAARECKGDYLLLLNNDTEVIASAWLTAMLGYAQLPGIGAVGAKLYYPHDSIQHAGVVLGMRGIAGHWLYRFPRDSRGYFNSLHTVRNFSAVTAACLLTRRDVFESVGGFEEELAVSYNDVDVCLRIRKAGYRIVWVPEAELYHCEFATRTQVLDPKEVEYMQKKWGDILRNDPYYNPNLTLESGALALRF